MMSVVTRPIMLNVVMPSVVMLNVVMLSVVAPTRPLARKYQTRSKHFCQSVSDEELKLKNTGHRFALEIWMVGKMLAR